MQTEVTRINLRDLLAFSDVYLCFCYSAPPKKDSLQEVIEYGPEEKMISESQSLTASSVFCLMAVSCMFVHI